MTTDPGAPQSKAFSVATRLAAMIFLIVAALAWASFGFWYGVGTLIVLGIIYRVVTKPLR